MMCRRLCPGRDAGPWGGCITGCLRPAVRALGGRWSAARVGAPTNILGRAKTLAGAGTCGFVVRRCRRHRFGCTAKAGSTGDAGSAGSFRGGRRTPAGQAAVVPLGC